MAIQIQLRRGDATDWTSSNPILAEGEVGIELDTNKLKIGNGIDHWNSLTYFNTATLTSVGMTVPTGLQVSGSPITSSGTLAVSYASGYSIPTTASQTNWDSAYTDRLKWDGGATGLVAATGRTSLGLGSAATLNAGSAGGVATLDGGGTVPTSQLPSAVLGGVKYQGTWNASTNTPTLTSSSGTQGYYYVVSVAGSTNLDGITDWKIGDWAIYNGTAWQKVDNTDAVTSVNGYTGTVVLAASDVGAYSNTNPSGYVNQAGARSAISASGSLSYDSSTGVISYTQPTNVSTFTNDSGYLTGITSIQVTTALGYTPLNPTTSQTANTVYAAPNGSAGAPTFRAIVAADIPTLNQNTTGTASNVTGTVAIANGGTGATTQQNALNAIAGAVTNAQFLRGNGTNVVLAAIQASDVPTLNQNTTGTAANVTGVVAIANGGSGQTTAQSAMNTFAGAVTSGQYLRGNGTNVVMSAIQVADVPTLNQNTTGTAGSLANSLTIGSGLSGTSFNGSTSVTIAIDSTVTTLSGTQTLTNKRVTPRVSTTTSSATPSINTDNVDMYGLTAQAVDITSFSTNLTGTPTDGQKLWIYIVGTAARAIAWGSSFESSTATLPTTTVSTNRLDVGFVWNTATSKWRCVATA